ncbi:Phosphoribosylformylglycinamidine synthase subunit PurL [Posidoniimonas polymericola]|uniref:Phosphoribosylformylglycinamidine synthase subunit PurL n=1 Tax=Posidoniimonas polymericola TaxID=2528002 RepID=A0A5C5YPI4_9BACT|nr:phosphoribosylformylglycinamidine synthase subunit PurL [Posidoniimonas polymericola]TWT76872.1 Phosphoribosylformylglycinamidine synthase subunit PurL [Posidoniimonas polymericola]
MLWEVDIHPAASQADRAAERLIASARAAGYSENLQAATARSFLVQGEHLGEAELQRICDQLLCDRVVEQAVFAPVGDDRLVATPERLTGDATLVQVLPKPGVMDPVALSAETAIADLGVERPLVRTLNKYWLTGVDAATAQSISDRLLANDAIEQAVLGPLSVDHLDAGGAYEFKLQHVQISGLDDAALMRLSKEGQLYLQLAEMQTIQRYFADLGREPTDIELETLAQTWSEHCSHKTLAGRIAYRDENGERTFDNMLKETIFAATLALRERWGDDDWCVSIFKDNAGIVRFDDEDNIAFKVETHNHPSALEPYGGANTGLGGVIRDTLGTGLGAKPVCSTDVFCFAPPTADAADLPPGVLHPRRVMQGVVEGVRDYGNRMGIPTVNGAVYFDERYLGNPLVYCGNAGIIPRDKSFKEPLPGDLAVAIGGRTGRDGIHGATFSSAELTSESEDLSGGAVQIGNAIEEKRVLDVLLQARDRGLYTAVTDCGAGGFSSAVGEMGEEIGAEVWLEKAPLKYDGLSYTEIWISEAQERMVFSVPEEKLEEFQSLCGSEGVEAIVIGRYTPTGNLLLKYGDEVVGELPMSLLHDGRPPVVRQASYTPAPIEPLNPPDKADYTDDLLKILGSLNVASKEWVIRQYDHEVQGGSVVKPLVGVKSDGPGDAAVVRPKLASRRGMVISCGMNPRYGDLDTGRMAASAIDEAVRNCVAVGADPTRIAVLDNFCWGDCEKPETLGSLVRAAITCHDLSLELETPFVSGKDSLNNEFSYESDGQKQTIAIPPSLLISAMGQVADVESCVTMDLKQAGNALYLIGDTRDELGGSHFALVNNLTGGAAPNVNGLAARETFLAMHRAISGGLVRSCHDLSEGGLAAAAAEMAFAGELGAQIDLSSVPFAGPGDTVATRLFSETNTRFLCEVAPENEAAFTVALGGRAAKVGVVTEDPKLTIESPGGAVVSAPLDQLKAAWKSPLAW